MKKQFLILAAAMMVFSLVSVSCDKEEPNTGDEGTKDIKVRISSFTESDQDGSWADIYKYSYDNAGKITGITREDSKGVINREYAFAYSGQTITVALDKKTGDPAYTFATITLGDNGLAANLKDEWDETYTYAYDANGFMTEVKRDGALRSTITIANNCISTWTRLSDGNWQTKAHTYSADKNVAGIHNIYSESCGAGRWLVETGLFGKGSALLCESNQWQHSAIASTLTYTLDANKCVTKETKTYDGWEEYYSYTWTALK